MKPQGEVLWNHEDNWFGGEEGWYYLLTYYVESESEAVLSACGPFRTKRQAKRALRRAMRDRRNDD